MFFRTHELEVDMRISDLDISSIKSIFSILCDSNTMNSNFLIGSYTYRLINVTHHNEDFRKEPISSSFTGDTMLFVSGVCLVIFSLLTCLAWFITHYWLTKLVPVDQHDDTLELIIDDDTEVEDDEDEAVFTIEGFR